MRRHLAKRSPWRKVDLVVLLVVPPLAVISSLVLKANLLVSTFLFYGILSVYFSIRTPGGITRALIFSLFADFFAFFVGDYFAYTDGSWFSPTIFPFRIYNLLPVEELIWITFASYAVLIIYEHFIDKGRHPPISRRAKTVLLVYFLFSMLFFFRLILGSSEMRVPYTYLFLGVGTMLIPTIVVLVRYPGFLGSFVKVGAYFFGLNILHELTALSLGQWFFPGVHFIGWVELFGLRMPFEEFFFFILLFPIAVLCYFEYFDDDKYFSHLKGKRL